MSFLHALLWPLTYVLGLVYDGIHQLVGSAGWSIVLLSIAVRTVTAPISRLGRKYEQRERDIQIAMAPAVAAAKKEYSGRRRFEEIDAIYQQHGYHPIQSMASIIPLAVQIPFLLAALFLLIDHPALQGTAFGPIGNLGLPDGLLGLSSIGPLNLLPIALTVIALLELLIQPQQTTSGRVRFTVVSLVLLVLIYPLPAAVCLYWLTSNVFSLGSTAARTILSRSSHA